MSGIKPFSFADLDEDGSAPIEEKRVEEPVVHTESALQAACEAAYQRGQADGAAAAEQAARLSNDEAVRTAITTIADAARKMLDGEAARLQMLEDGSRAVAMAIARKLMPSLARRGGLEEIEQLVAETVSTRPDQARLVVRIGDDSFDALRDAIELAAAQHGFEGRLVMLADADLAAGDCRIEWADGGIERVIDQLLADIEKVAERHGGPGAATSRSDPETVPGYRPAAITARQ